MEEGRTFEDAFLEEAVESRKPVKLIHTTGYQQDVTVIDYTFDAILAIRHDGKRSLIYRHGLSTIVMD